MFDTFVAVPERRRPRRRLVTALFAATVLVAAVGLVASVVPLWRPEKRVTHVPRTVLEPKAVAPVRVAPALPPPSDAPEPGPYTPKHCPSPPPAPSPAPARAAFAKVARLDVHHTPGGARTKTLTNPTREGFPLALSVLRYHGTTWALVQHPGRPNGASGWVRRAHLGEYLVPYQAIVELCARRVTVYRSGKVVLREPVAVGAPRWPTPTGRFYIEYSYKTPNPRGAYGPWLLSIVGYSNVLTSFNGGIGQIAFHGTNRPSSIGKAASHGCLRMRNDAITRLKQIAMPGMPVTIRR